MARTNNRTVQEVASYLKIRVEDVKKLIKDGVIGTEIGKEGEQLIDFHVLERFYFDNVAYFDGIRKQRRV